jgi:hypothetical protein
VNSGRVPAELQEPLLSGVAALADQTPVCLARVTPVTTTAVVQQAPSGTTADRPRPAKAKGRDKGHGKGGATHHKHHRKK